MRKLQNINLDDLVEAGIIDETTATAILAHQAQKRATAPNRLGLVLSVLGAALIGLGIMLIIAHNWDNFSRPLKTFLAFLPMIIGQAACGYTLYKEKESKTWQESSAVFLFFAVGACIGMVSQIYNLEGELSSFLLTWMLLVLPLIYLTKSSIVSLLYLAGITWYATSSGYVHNNEPYIYVGLLALAMPYYYRLYQNQPTSNAFNYHAWAIALSLLITLGTWAKDATVLMWVAYVSLLAAYFMIGCQPFFRAKRSRNNPFLLLGLLGTIGLFLGFTFYGYWEEIVAEKMHWNGLFLHREFWVSFLLIASSLYLIVSLKPIRNFSKISPIPFGFLLFLLVFFIGYNYPIIGMILSNLFVLSIGVFYIYRGNELNRLGILNLGMLILAALIMCRFFDLELSFVTRGVLFVLVGIGFFITNYQLIKRREKVG
ncbi:MAG: DUF2157 domain-containing protein [Saprospiraceae bacterium]